MGFQKQVKRIAMFLRECYLLLIIAYPILHEESWGGKKHEESWEKIQEAQSKTGDK